MIQKIRCRNPPVLTQTIRTLSEFEDLRKVWEQIDSDPMNSFDWNLSWWSAFQSTGELNIIKFERDGETVGIAPFYVDKWYGAKRLRFLGSGKTCSDYLDLICLTEDLDTLGVSFADYIRDNKFGVVELEGTRCDRLSLQLKSLLLDDYRMDHRDIEPTWVLDLPDSWDEFVKSSKSSIRRKLRKCEKRLASGECTISTTADGVPLEEAFESFKKLHQRRFVSKGEPGIFSDPNFEAFMKDGIFRLCRKQQAEIILLKHEDTTIGAQTNLISNSGFQYYQSGYSPEHMQFEPGYLMFTSVIKTSIDRGYESFDFLRGNEPYKAKWGARPSEHKQLRLVSRRFASTAHAACVNGARKVANLRR